jgi:acylphosphatase
VGFRFTAARLAPGFAVAGFVRNEPDGSVVLEAQGDPSQIQAFLRAIHSELGSKIHQADESTFTPETTDGPGSFDIRY